MIGLRILMTHAWVLSALLLVASVASAQTAEMSIIATWTCEGTDCPWGPTASGHAAEWPAETTPVMERYDYTLSDGIYVTGAEANGATITIESGSASVYKGLPDGAHTLVTSINPGESYVVQGVGDTEVVSVQSNATFTYAIELGDAEPVDPPPVDPPPVDPVPGTSGASTNTVWSCAGTNCPWGASVSAHAIDWPAAVAPSNARYDYVASSSVYISDDYANGMAIRIDSGAAQIFRGTLQGTDEVVANLGPGDVYVVDDFLEGEVLSVEGQFSFTYTLQPATPDDPPPVDPPPYANSTWVTWTCGGANCPWGASASGHAAEWPAETTPVMERYDYTLSDGIYVTGAEANGATITVEIGSASVYKGLPDGAHTLVISINPGESYVVQGVGDTEVVSVQSSASFTYAIELGDAEPVDPPPGDPGPSPDTNSTWVTWTCGGANCPWGASVSGEAAEWPAEQLPLNDRYDYMTSHGMYLPADAANRLTIAVGTGSAVLYAGLPDGAHRIVAELASGEVYTVGGLAAGEVLSAQSGGQFTFGIEFSDESDPGPDDPPPVDPTPGSWPPGIGPVVPGAVSSVNATWECSTPGCTQPLGSGAVIDWPEWSAYSNNGQSDPAFNLTVYDGDGSELHPYMGRWADGCLVTAEAGDVVVVELQRGSATWRETWLEPGESHQIALQGDEDGAIIESGEGGAGFAVSLAGCVPAPVSNGLTPVDPTPSQEMLDYTGASELAIWSCTGTDCPWGATVSVAAAVWPAEANPVSARYDYAVSKAAYLTADLANGLEITVESGLAHVFIGTTNGNDVVVATLSNGESYVVSGLAPGEVVSLESDLEFTYRVKPPEPPDPDMPVAIESVAGYWYCDLPGCNYAPWTGRVIDWNHWSAYQNNARSAESNSRTIYDANGEPLHPYMGAWADGCTVKAVEGETLIIEWERGTDVWRETYLNPGESYTINLIGSEDGALIESNDINSPFSVTLEGCEPAPLP